MKTNAENKIKQVLLLLAATSLLTACGGTSYQESLPGNGGGPIIVASPAPTASPYPYPSPSPTGGLLPPISQTFSITGSTNSFSQTVMTDNILKVRITALPAGLTPLSGYNASYGCISYQVSAAGLNQTTQVLAASGAAYYCPSGTGSEIIDFSANLTPGHGPITVTVKPGVYDYYAMGCWNWKQANPQCDYYPYNLYQSCVNPWTAGQISCNSLWPHTVYQNHTVTGKIDIQVNGTSL